MDSSSQSANTPDTSPHRLADIVGTAIALLTLTLPIFAIANYSASNVRSNVKPLTQQLQQTKD